jgi:hypothetical protein
MEVCVHTGPIEPYWRHKSADYNHYWFSTKFIGEELSWNFLLGENRRQCISVFLQPSEINPARTISYEVIYSPDDEYQYHYEEDMAMVIGPLKPNQYNEAPKPNDRVLRLKIKLDVSETLAPEQCMAQVSSVIKKTIYFYL